jgi:hypothetical protein
MCQQKANPALPKRASKCVFKEILEICIWHSSNILVVINALGPREAQNLVLQETNQESCFVQSEVLTAAVMKSNIFWDITSCSPLNVNWRFGPASALVSCSAYSSTLNIEEICSSETSADIQQTTRRYMPEDSTLNFAEIRTENLMNSSLKY